WPKFCGIIGHPNLGADARFLTVELRTRHHAELEPILSAAIAKRSTAEWVAAFDEAGFPCGPLNTIAQAAEHPQVRARDMLVNISSERGSQLTIANSPLRLSRTPAYARGGPPALGRHTRELLRDRLGMSEAEIDQGLGEGAVGG